MHRALIAGLLIHSAADAAVITGDWTLEPTTSAFRLVLTRSNVIAGARSVLTVRLSDLQGFTPESLQSGGLLVFTMIRDAGTFRFEGRPSEGRALGRFEFTEDRAFVAGLRQRAMDWWDPNRIFDLAVRGVAAWPVSPAALPLNQALRDPTQALRDPDPRSRAIRALVRSGYPLTPREAARLDAMGVTSDFLRQMKLSGHDALSVTDMLRLQSHGVTEHDVRFFEARGKTNLTVDEIVKLKANGVE